MTREQMIDRLVMNDMQDIIQAWQDNDTEFFQRVLRGVGWKPYNQLTDSEVENEYNDREFPEEGEE